MANREAVQGFLEALLATLLLLYRGLREMYSLLLVHSVYTMLSYSYMTLSGAIAMDYIKTLRDLKFGRFRTLGAVGWMIGTLPCGWMAENLGFDPLFFPSSILFIASAAGFISLASLLAFILLSRSGYASLRRNLKTTRNASFIILYQNHNLTS